MNYRRNYSIINKLLIILLVTILIKQNSYAQSVTLESVDGTFSDSLFSPNKLISFNIKLTNNSSRFLGITNGFRVYSPDGATWSTTVADTVGTIGLKQFDLVFLINTSGITGSGADTVGFGGAALLGTGLVPYFDDRVFTLTIGPIPETSLGKTICIDSSFYPPSGSWKWRGPDEYPSWDGPHCFTVCDGDDLDSDGIPDMCDECPTDPLNDPDADGACNSTDNCPENYNPNQLDANNDGVGDSCCCIGKRGNIDFDNNETIDASDLVFLVAFAFQKGPHPACLQEADFNGSGGIVSVDIHDIVLLIHYLYARGFPPSPCPK